MRRLNNLTSDILQVGQKIIIGTNNLESTEPETITYTVQKGDSLWTIASKYNVSVNDIIKQNNLTTNILQIGQELIIPVTTLPPSQSSEYTVQRGDSLWTIANKFNTTVAELRRVNNLTSDTLQIGQVLKIPSIQSNEITDYSLEEYNPITNTLTDFESIEIPDFEEIIDESDNFTTIPPNANDTQESNNDFSTENQREENPNKEKDNIIEEYQVKKGDSLWLIAKKYNTTVTNLINYNELESINLKINDILKIPTETENRNYYTVEKGDTLWSIASSHNLSFQELKEINNLKDNSVTLGQKLIIK